MNTLLYQPSVQAQITINQVACNALLQERIPHTSALYPIVILTPLLASGELFACNYKALLMG